MSRKTTGFTLIELLVVIAIIGILSSVVLASLNTARAKGQDAKVKAQLSGARASAEIYFDNNGNYGSVVSDDCASEFFADPDSGMAEYANQSNYPEGATLSCRTDGLAYAISALLISSSTGAAWCVDNTGATKEIPANLAVGEISCP